ncbi:endonuclease domain-containing protein [Streptomyces flaveus]|uniref:endonuclease domain-containing protein n=1 Tax=Streptomyces flaveus TaxID=66370 RepID=UPI0035711D95
MLSLSEGPVTGRLRVTRRLVTGPQPHRRECWAESRQRHQNARGKNVRHLVRRPRDEGQPEAPVRHDRRPARRDDHLPDGPCVISPKAPVIHVDHCHETGRVRDVLCFSRNAALGQFKDRPDVIRRAATYVEGNAWKPTLVAPGVYRLPS